MTDSNTALIRSLTMLGSVVIAAIVSLAIWGPPASNRADSAIQTIVTVVTVIIGGLLSLKGSADAKQEAIKSKDASRSNTAALAVVNEKVTKAVDGVDTVHGIVDGQRHAMEAQIAALRASVEDLKGTLAHERAVTPAPSPATPTGPGGTVISPGGPTTIAPDGPVTVVLPADVKIVKDGTS